MRNDRWQDRRIAVEITPATVSVRLIAGNPLAVTIHGRSVTLTRRTGKVLFVTSYALDRASLSSPAISGGFLVTRGFKNLHGYDLRKRHREAPTAAGAARRSKCT